MEIRIQKDNPDIHLINLEVNSLASEIIEKEITDINGKALYTV